MEYKLVKTRVEGRPSLVVNRSDREIYLHSKYNPTREAKAWVDRYYKGDGVYLVLGLGLGYHILELRDRLLKGGCKFKIYVVETNYQVYKFFEKVNKGGLRDPNIEIIRVFKGEGLGNGLVEDINICIHEPSTSIIPDEFEPVKNFILTYKSMANMDEDSLSRLYDNFNENIKNYDEYVNRLFGKYLGESMIIVSAGPSLDKNIDQLRYNESNIIVSTGRAVNALVYQGILPDFIIVTDPLNNLYKKQLEGLNLKVPIIVLSTCDYNIMKNYKGKKYIAFQRDYKPGEDYAKSKNLELIETGGSVATTALDIGIRMGFRRIIFIGQDLALTGGKTHSNMSQGSIVDDDIFLQEVEDISGNKVLTKNNLNIYRKWIERRISKEPLVEFIDATEGGARIVGTRVCKLRDVINS